MLFSSIVFLFFFFPLVLVVYYCLCFSRTAQNTWLLISSLIFYAWGEPMYVLLMIFSIFFNSLFGTLIDRQKNPGAKKKILITNIVGNIGILFFFKYLLFVLGIFGVDTSNMHLPLPIGISFFTFQALSYVLDVYSGKTKSENPFYVGLYISFFPQLIAGPILQYHTVAEQIRFRKSSFDKLSVGICRFTVGLGKKVLLSNCFAAIADHVFEWSAIGIDKLAVPATLAWLGSIAYTLQIYYDFSAYSDMAIGLGLCFGFKFPENFNYPYIAESVSDFWQRWHISLTNWFREYVYFPLGGSRVKNQDTMVRNIFIVWLLTGIWHGANWTFILWGMYYFLLQLAERFFGYHKKIKSKALRHLYALLVVNAGWVIFRADDLFQAGRFFLNMLGLNQNGFFSDTALMLVRENWVFLLLGIVFAMPLARSFNEYLYNDQNNAISRISTAVYPIGMSLIFVISVCYLASGSYNPFIYFNF